MAYNAEQQRTVPVEQYQYALTNFRIAHEEVEKQRRQLEEQERQVAQLRERIAILEGARLQSGSAPNNRGTSSVDDHYIRSYASQLAAHINRWAGEVVRDPHSNLTQIRDAIMRDLYSTPVLDSSPATSMQVQNLLRHVMSDAIAEGVINCLIVTNSSEVNVHLSRIHDQLFSRDPRVAGVWRRQTFSAAVEQCTPEMSANILAENLQAVSNLLSTDDAPAPELLSILDEAYVFSRMLHGSTTGSTTEAFYRAFVPELGSPLDPSQLELIRRCLRSERGQVDCVGACVFPGLVKVTLAPGVEPGQVNPTTVSTVVKRAQVICQCALITGQGMVHPGVDAPPTPVSMRM